MGAGELMRAALTRPDLPRLPKMFMYYSSQELIQMLWGS